MLEYKISIRSKATPASFIRNILKATENKNVVSFAGGLPNPISFPEEKLKESCNRVIDTYQSAVFQYSTTAGILPLRSFIADRLNHKYHMDIDPEEIIITTGSQQALDIIGKILINEGDHIVVEEPGYLGAIQAFSQYLPHFDPVTLEEDGLDLQKFEDVISANNIKFAYMVPNYQNPTGITYSDAKRKEVVKLAKKYNTIIVEDDPYGELCFEGSPKGYMSAGDPSGSILLGTFSKTVTPGMRIGYAIIRDSALRNAFNVAKSAADLHTNVFSQYVIYDYLTHNDIEEHIDKIKELYRKQCSAMLAAIEDSFPKDASFTKPIGGMFLWATIPDRCGTSLELFEKANSEDVVFVPGNPFYTDSRNCQSMRLNYTNSSCEEIMRGIGVIGGFLQASQINV